MRMPLTLSLAGNSGCAPTPRQQPLRARSGDCLASRQAQATLSQGERTESEAKAAKVENTRGAGLAALQSDLGWNAFHAPRGLCPY